MAISGVPSRRGIYEDDSLNNPGEAGSWYLSKKEIEENSPSKRDGIDLKKEAYLRKSYCTFLQDLGMRLKVPQVTIATAIIFCHRFFLRHSHATNDRRTIATVCMFLAGKVEETPRPLKDVILVSYEINHKNDPDTAQRIKHKEVFEEQKEMILVLERLLLATLAFDLNLIHPYKPLVEAIKKFKVAQHALAQVAWNFVNDGLRTSLCLQFKPHHIAAGAIFLAAKFLKVKLPSDWWQEFDVTPRQLEEVSNQMLELYEQNRAPPSQGSEIEGSTGGRVSHRAPSKVPTSTPLKSLSPAPENTSIDNGDCGIMKKKICSNKVDGIIQENQNQFPNVENKGESVDVSRPGSEELLVNQEKNVEKVEIGEAQKFLELTERISESPREAIKKIDKDKYKAALEKRRKFRGSMTRKMENMDEDDLIERELEDGIELAAENEKIKQERRQSLADSKPSNRSEDDISDKPRMENVEEGAVCAVDEVGRGSQSPESSNRKRKVDVSPVNIMNGKKQQHENFACVSLREQDL